MFFHERPKYKGKILAAGLIGAAAGFIAGLMAAPKNGKDMRKDVQKWANDMAGEIRERVKNTADITQEKYNELVDTVSQKYRSAQDIKTTEVDDLTQDLKDRWDRVKGEWDK